MQKGKCVGTNLPISGFQAARRIYSKPEKSHGSETQWNTMALYLNRPPNSSSNRKRDWQHTYFWGNTESFHSSSSAKNVSQIIICQF